MSRKRKITFTYVVEYPEGVFHTPDADGWFHVHIPASEGHIFTSVKVERPGRKAAAT